MLESLCKMDLHVDLLLVDGRNLLYRMTWAHQSLFHSGRSTGGIYGFLSTLVGLKEALGASRVCVCWEGATNWRLALYPEYKAQRTRRASSYFDTRAAVNEQEPRLCRILSAVGVSQFRPIDGECDDVIASIVAGHSGISAILSQDRDLYQLVDMRCFVLRVKGESLLTVSSSDVSDELGVPPALVADLKALAGDPSDNIPGARGVGPKTAAKLLRYYGSFESVLDAAGTTAWAGTKRQARAIEAARSDLMTYRELTRLRVTGIKPVSDTEAPIEDLLHDEGLVSFLQPPALESLRRLRN